MSLDYVLWLHSGLTRRRMEAVNENSVTTAKLATLVEALLYSFGGDGTPRSPQEFLPYQIPDPNDPEWQKKQLIRQHLTQQTADEFWRLYDEGKLPNYVEKAFVVSGDVKEVLQSMKRK